MNGAIKTMDSAARELLGGDLMDELTGCFERMSWAEDEITQAQKRRPSAADKIWHSFRLLSPADSIGFERFGVEFVYRSHCRELLDRVAAGHDTRPGTAAEVIIAASEASKVAPLTETGYALTARLWRVAFPGQPDPWAEARVHYEALRGSRVDDMEREIRHKTRQDERRLGDITCRGQHNGQRVACSYALLRQMELTEVA